MLQPKVHPHFNSKVSVYHAPGKIFLVGEYAALTGSPSLIAAVGPRFRMNVENCCESKMKDLLDAHTLIHPKSPLGRLMDWVRQKGYPSLLLNFEDPFLGAGGFGASTAQFVMAYYAYFNNSTFKSNLNWKQAWSLYREIMSDEPLLPSGADLVAQWQGGMSYFDPKKSECKDLWPYLDWSHFLLFSATQVPDRKTPTHEHLRNLAHSGFPQGYSQFLLELNQILIDGKEAILAGNIYSLAKALNQYAETLYRYELEAPAMTKDRLAIQQLPGVLAVKGAGALQSDALWVLIDPAQGDRKRITEFVESRGLKLVQSGLNYQMGVMCQN